jgi:hypothetical protein
MTDTPKDKLFLTDHMKPLKGPYLCLWTSQRGDDLLTHFKAACYRLLPKELGWFHQSDTENFQMFEFWRPDSALMAEAAQKIAEELRLPLENNLAGTYPEQIG